MTDEPEEIPNSESEQADANWQLSVEWITLRIRWFGLIVGYLVVNTIAAPDNRLYLNGMLTVGFGYAFLDWIWHRRGEVFLSKFPLFVSLMEAIFIGLLCYFDKGIDSFFRYYYFLSLLVCAIRYSPMVAYSTFALHATSFSMLAFSLTSASVDHLATMILMIVFMGWTTWASIALTTLIRQSGEKLSELNRDLELRIERRTKDLQQSQALLVQQEKQAAFGLLAAGIAHEVGNPLAAISSLVQLMNRKELDPQMHERLGLIDEQLLRIQRTLRELIEFSRPGLQQVTRFDVHDVINNALNIAKYYKRKKGKSIQTKFADNLPQISAVRDQILQVFLNLILNALDATEEGEGITIETTHTDQSVIISVTDNGRGIIEADRSKLFEPYFTTKSTGTGLGLFISKNIVEQANGRIELLEAQPRQTTFSVTLPI
ncbi:sensor histidine kinase [Planctomicrobium sp. SH527]|uniref:sensor histidine kinase n=1 Tax=Planctomicrobium sp. SH527 TaxID=3448123 RepID=UPI003F5B4276